ncbi:MAG: ABC transporter ATP-binding protein [SAR324 cluster bacterium]|nr:ABC transporter ATP-binding protein [SAR324 cluster bacterium]
MQTILDVKQLTMDFGGLRAIDHVDLDIKQGEIVALIGPNGAGKTTFFNCITGIYKPTGGDVLIAPPEKKQKRINGKKPNQITVAGLARTFQNIRLFANMTVLENVMIGQHCRTRTGIAGAVFQGKKVRAEERRVIDYSHTLLKKVGLDQYVHHLAKNLPYANQRRLEIARALATDPFLLLLDEPAAGMNPQETAELDQFITRIRDEENVSILLIEHDMRLVMSISDRIFVVDYGKKIAQGTPAEIQNNKNVIKAYLGEDIDDA